METKALSVLFLLKAGLLVSLIGVANVAHYSASVSRSVQVLTLPTRDLDSDTTGTAELEIKIQKLQIQLGKSHKEVVELRRSLREQSGTVVKTAAVPKKNKAATKGGSCPAKENRNGAPIPYLDFVHIQKTGGTAIEHSAAAKGIHWGKMAFHQRGLRYNKTALQGRNTGAGWHVPPKFFRNYPKNVTTFAVVRNPYDQVVSQYYQPFKVRSRKQYHEIADANPCKERTQSSKFCDTFTPGDFSIEDPAYMNAVIQGRFRSKEQIFYQDEYVFDEDGNQIIDHVLRFENLEEEFNQLMECYGLNVTLSATTMNGRQKSARLTTKDLTLDTVALINRVEKTTFERFGYTMKDTSASHEMDQP